MAEIGPKRRCAAQRQAATMLGGVLATQFGRTCRLEDLVHKDALDYFTKLGTNSKVVIKLGDGW